MFTRNQSYAFLSKLQSIIKNVKTTRLSTPYRLIVGIALGGVTQKNEQKIRYRAFFRKKQKGWRIVQKNKTSIEKQKKPLKFKLNDKERISHLRQREYEKNGRGKLKLVRDTVVKVKPSINKKIFGEELLTGTFFSQELQKVH